MAPRTPVMIRLREGQKKGERIVELGSLRTGDTFRTVARSKDGVKAWRTLRVCYHEHDKSRTLAQRLSGEPGICVDFDISTKHPVLVSD